MGTTREKQPNSSSILSAHSMKIDKKFLLKLTVIISIAFSILTLRYAIDISINGFDRNKKLETYREQIARPDFKPSVIKNEPLKAFFTLNLQGKGIPLIDIFIKKGWIKTTAESYMGKYGYLKIPSPDLYYYMMYCLYLGFFISIFAVVILHGSADDYIRLILFGIACGLILAASIYNSWVIDFQPQGRYLFPVIPCLAFFLHTIQDKMMKSLYNIFMYSLFMLSYYSFVCVALNQMIVFY
jgi:hypothetical protein